MNLPRKYIRHLSVVAACVLLCAHLAVPRAQYRPGTQRRKPRRPDVIFVPTPPETVEEMLRLAGIQKGDVLYDLGSGDGRIPIRAAQKFGIRAVGIDIDPKLIAAAEEAARQAGVAHLVQFRNEDLFRADIHEASVVTLYLSDSLNLKLRPKLLRDLRPGTRIISHDFRMGDWRPERVVRVPWLSLYRTVYVWRVPRGGRIKRAPLGFGRRTKSNHAVNRTASNGILFSNPRRGG